MKEFSELHIPDDRRYSDDHEWVVAAGDGIRIGISDYAQDQLGDIVFVELPKVGARIARNSEFGVVESVKSVSSLLMPVGGEITAVNTGLDKNPDYVNASPYDKGWLIEVRPDSPAELDELLTADDYIRLLRGE